MARKQLCAKKTQPVLGENLLLFFLHKQQKFSVHEIDAETRNWKRSVTFMTFSDDCERKLALIERRSKQASKQAISVRLA